MVGGLTQLITPTKLGPLAKIINKSALYSTSVILWAIRMQVASVVVGTVTAITAAAVIMVAAAVVMVTAVTMVVTVIVVVVMVVDVVVMVVDVVVMVVDESTTKIPYLIG